MHNMALYQHISNIDHTMCTTRYLHTGWQKVLRSSVWTSGKRSTLWIIDLSRPNRKWSQYPLYCTGRWQPFSTSAYWEYEWATNFPINCQFPVEFLFSIPCSSLYPSAIFPQVVISKEFKSSTQVTAALKRLGEWWQIWTEPSQKMLQEEFLPAYTTLAHLQLKYCVQTRSPNL